MQNTFDVIVVGGGAAGFFAALTTKKTNPKSKVLLLEKSGSLLSKVRVSGGGRCNVTHSCFDVKQLVQNYPRGGKELLGPFSRFQPKDTIHWFESRGVDLNTEDDGRMFPVTNTSSTIIECFLKEGEHIGLEIRIRQKLEKISKMDQDFHLTLATGDILKCKKLLLATGNSPQGHAFAQSLGHTIQEPVPSLFTFNIASFPLIDLAGITVEQATTSLPGSQFAQSGPLLITHWGFSGPAALKLSAWGARFLHEKNYQTKLNIDWLPLLSKNEVTAHLHRLRSEYSNQNLANTNPFGLAKKLWKRLIERSGIEGEKKCSVISNQLYAQLCDHLKIDSYNIDGKTTYKEEFVTCGGVSLSEVNFKTIESRICKNLFFAGEVLDVDAVTGGFNFQNAWTTGWVAGQAMAEDENSMKKA